MDDLIDREAWGAFQTQLVKRMEYFKVSASRIVRQQASYFARGLMKIVPPKDKKQTEENIENRVDLRFHLAMQPKYQWKESHELQGIQWGSRFGNKDVIWYGWNAHGLYGVTRNRDMTGASTQKLKNLFYKLTESGRVKAGMRGKQTVYLWQGIVTGKRELEKVKTYLKRHVGRLKAGWLPSWRASGGLGGNPPQWIQRHEQGARGRFEDDLESGDHPAFTLINFAAGAGEIDAYFINKELKLRAQAMAKDLELYINGTKKAGESPVYDSAESAFWKSE